MKQKYAYFIAGQIGSSMSGNQCIEYTHFDYNERHSYNQKRQIKQCHFAEMMKLFKIALEENNVSEENSNELMSVLNPFEDRVCVKVEEAENLCSIEKALESEIFKQLMEELIQKLTALSEYKEALKPYTQEDGKLLKDIKYRVACILSNLNTDDLEISSEELSSFSLQDNQDITPELIEVTDIFFDMLEEKNDDFDYECIDQLKKLFLIIDPQKADIYMNV